MPISVVGATGATGRSAAKLFALSALSFDDCADCLLRTATGEPSWNNRHGLPLYVRELGS